MTMPQLTLRRGKFPCEAQNVQFEAWNFCFSIEYKEDTDCERKSLNDQTPLAEDGRCGMRTFPTILQACREITLGHLAGLKHYIGTREEDDYCCLLRKSTDHILLHIDNKFRILTLSRAMRLRRMALPFESLV